MVDRYLLLDTLLLNLLVFELAGRLWGLIPGKGWLWVGGLLLLAAGSWPMLRKGKEKLLQSSGDYTYYQRFHEELKGLDFLEGQRLASDSASALEAVQLTYHFQALYYGVWKTGSYSLLQENKIRYVLRSRAEEMPGLRLRAKLDLPGRNLCLFEVIKSE